MAFGSKEYNDIFDSYKKGQKWLNDVEVEIVGGEADVDPLTLLRIYDDKITVDNELVLASGFCMNRCVRFLKGGEVIHEVFYKGEISENILQAVHICLMYCSRCLMLSC